MEEEKYADPLLARASADRGPPLQSRHAARAALPRNRTAQPCPHCRRRKLPLPRLLQAHHRHGRQSRGHQKSTAGVPPSPARCDTKRHGCTRQRRAQWRHGPPRLLGPPRQQLPHRTRRRPVGNRPRHLAPRRHALRERPSIHRGPSRPAAAGVAPVRSRREEVRAGGAIRLVHIPHPESQSLRLRVPAALRPGTLITPLPYPNRLHVTLPTCFLSPSLPSTPLTATSAHSLGSATKEGAGPGLAALRILPQALHVYTCSLTLGQTPRC